MTRTTNSIVWAIPLLLAAGMAAAEAGCSSSTNASDEKEPSKPKDSEHSMDSKGGFDPSMPPSSGSSMPNMPSMPGAMDPMGPSGMGGAMVPEGGMPPGPGVNPSMPGAFDGGGPMADGRGAGLDGGAPTVPPTPGTGHPLCPPDGVLEREPNNSPQTPHALTFGTVTCGTVSGDDPVDIYSIVPPDGGSLCLKVDRVDRQVQPVIPPTMAAGSPVTIQVRALFREPAHYVFRVTPNRADCQ